MSSDGESSVCTPVFKRSSPDNGTHGISRTPCNRLNDITVICTAVRLSMLFFAELGAGRRPSGYIFRPSQTPQ